MAEKIKEDSGSLGSPILRTNSCGSRGALRGPYGGNPARGPRGGRRGTKARSVSPQTVRHSHLWGSRNPGFFGNRLQTSRTRASVEGSTAGLGQTLRVLWLVGLSFHDVSGLCTSSLAHGLNSGSRHEKADDAGLGLLLWGSDNCL